MLSCHRRSRNVQEPTQKKKKTHTDRQNAIRVTINYNTKNDKTKIPYFQLETCYDTMQYTFDC